MLLVSLLLSASAPPAAPLPSAAPVQRLLSCGTTADPAVRLACFDREAATLRDAIQRQDVTIVDRDSVRQARRNLFGLSLPRLAILGQEGADEVRQIESAIAGTSRNSDGGYIFRLADGSRWTQTDGNMFALAPKVGEAVSVRRAALGSFFLTVGRQPGVKVRRIN
jgi:hypothetical protein